MRSSKAPRRLILAAAILSTATGALSALGAERIFVVDPDASLFRIDVGKRGIASFAGHEHEVLAPAFTGRVVADDAEPSRSSVELRFEAGSLKVTGKGEPADDVPKVQEVMVGPRVLDAARFPTVEFHSSGVALKRSAPPIYDLEVTGSLSLHGVTRSLILPVRVETQGDRLVATGKTTLRQTVFGIRPVSAGAGTVKVKDELKLEFRIVARAAP